MFNISKKDLSDKSSANYSTAQLPWQLLADRVPAAKRLSRVLDEINFKQHPGDPVYTPGDDKAFMPNLLDYDWEKIILTAKDGKIGEGSPEGEHQLIPQRHKRHVAVIGAGVAGLCAGHELMKLGVQAVFYEMNRSDRDNFVVPFGRGFSWDWGCRSYYDDVEWDRGALSRGKFPQEPAVPNTKITPANWTKIYKRSLPRTIADFGAMRYPKSHTALRTYVDQIFQGMYHYDSSVESTWLDFRNPGVFSPEKNKGVYISPSDNDVLKYSTVISTAGIHGKKGGHFYRMEAGSKFKDLHPAIKTLSHKIWNLYYGAEGAGPKDNAGIGYLRKIIDLYKSYVEEMEKHGDSGVAAKFRKEIEAEWERLNEKFQGATVFEVLRNNGWAAEKIGSSPSDISLLQLYGEIGPGTGGSDVFWWTTFMDSLRVTIHHDEVDHQGFVGGTTYMLMPFLTKTVKAMDFRGSKSHETHLLAHTNEHRIADPVVAIRRPAGKSAGIEVVTMDSKGKTTAVSYDACILTASPAAIRARISIAPELLSKSAAFALRSLRLTNCGKIAIHFPYFTEKYSEPFWKKETGIQNSNDEIIVTTITDKNIRQIYTFDDSHWGTDTHGGTLMLSYTWDMNSDSFAALSEEQLVRTAWAQMKEIYSDPENARKLPDDVDNYLEWAIANKQYRALTWTSVDGVNGGYRMSSPGLNQPTHDSHLMPPQQALWAACTHSYNEDTKSNTGLFLAGEAIAWLALSGWIEGSIHTGLASTIGVIRHLNTHKDSEPVHTEFPAHDPQYHSYGFELPEHPNPFPKE